MDQGPAGLIPSIQQINAPRAPIGPAVAPQSATAPSGAEDSWLAQQRADHPDQWRQEQAGEEDGRLESLREEYGFAETAASKFAQGALDALLAPGALLGAGAESVGELYGNKSLRDFGRDLGEASSGKSAMEAFAGLAGAVNEDSAYEGAGYGDKVRERLERQDEARPMLSTLSRMAGMTALALTGGALAEGESAALASIAANAAEGSAGGAQAAYEHGAPLRDVLSSAAVGGVLGGALTGAAEGAQAGISALKKRAPDLAKVFGEKVQDFADTRALKAVIDRDRGAWKTFMRGGKERIQRVADRIRDSGVLGKGDDAMLEELANQSSKANGELAKLAESFDANGVVPDISKMDAAVAEQVAALEGTGSRTLQQVGKRIRNEIEPFRKKLMVGADPDASLVAERGLENIKFPKEGMREESLAKVRAEFDAGTPTRPVDITIAPNESGSLETYLQDGRHRLAVAKERGLSELPARISVMDAEGNIIRETTATVPIGPRPMTGSMRPPTFSELRTFKQGLGEAINWNGLDPLDQQMKRLWGTVSDGLNEAADQAGPGFRQAWREANEASSDFLTLKRALEKQMEGRNVRRFISPSDYATSITAGLATLIHSANPVAALAAMGASAIGHKLVREGGSAVVSSLANRFARMTRHVPLAKAGGPEAQEILQSIARTKAFMEDTAARAGANPTVQQAASESAKQVAAEQLAKRAGSFDPVNWHAKPLSPLQKMLYRTQVLDQASTDLSQIASATDQFRPPLPQELDAGRLAKLVKDGDNTAGIGALQALTDATSEAAPPTPTGDQAAFALRKLSLDLTRADPAEAMVKTHAAANMLKGMAEYAQDDLSREFAVRSEQALRAELSDPTKWGRAGDAYAKLTAAPAEFLTAMSKPEAVREALRTGKVMLGDKMREAYMAVRDAHDAALKLTGQRLQSAKELTTAMQRAEKLFDAADAAVRVDGKPMAALFDTAKSSGIYGAANAQQAVNERTVQEHVEQGLEKISPMLKEVSGGGYRPGAAAGSASLPAELTREQYDQRLRAATGAAAQPQRVEAPGMYAGVAPYVGEKLAQLLNDMPKPVKSIHGAPFDSLSRDDLRLANAMWEATTEPMSVFSDLADGTLDPDKASYAWKQYPGLQQAAQAGVLDVLMNDLNPEERTNLPDGVLTQLDAALGFGGTLQDANEPDFAQRMSKLYIPGPPKAQPNAMLSTPAAEPTFTQRLSGAMS